MQALFDIINMPLGIVLKFIAGIFSGNFAAAVFVFTLLINIELTLLSDFISSTVEFKTNSIFLFSKTLS